MSFTSRFKGKKYEYFYSLTSWGMYVSFEADVISHEQYEEKTKCIDVLDGLWIRILDGNKEYKTVFGQNIMVAEKFIQQGIKLISDKIVEISPYKNDTLIIFKDFGIADCDFQDEALTDAVLKWAELKFDIKGPQVKIGFNKKKNKYEFDFGQIAEKRT